MPEVLTKFDPFAWVKPKTPGDIIAVLDEALQELEYFNQLWDSTFGGRY